MIAEVIVDVPANQTDKPFDYLVPDEWSDLLEAGMRVIVPFGPRKLLGFVIGLKDASEFGKLRSILSIVDDAPVLGEELIALGDWLARTTLCYKIQAFQAILPSMMKASYKKTLRVSSDQSLEEWPELQTLFGKKKLWAWEDIQKVAPKTLSKVKKALKEGILVADQHVGDQRTYKTIKHYLLAKKANEVLASLTGRARKQHELLEWMLRQPVGASFSFSDLEQAVSATRNTVKTLVEKGALVEEEVDVFRDPYQKEIQTTEPLPLTREQQLAILPILKDLETDTARVHLCHGVTGSGKTEIYLQTIQEVLKKGEQAIVLVPEISLTPQMVDRFKGRFGSDVAVLHSGLSQGEKFDEWRKIQRDEVRVVVGARSAIFAPFSNLGVIIIDEEHETSYKQEETPRYHAKDVAVFRSRYHKCPVILGSATPSLESYARAQKGVYHLITLKERVNNRMLPPVRIVDMREELREGNRSIFSKPLLEALQDRLQKGEQSVLLLNRRGYSTFILCRDCGYVVKCPHCDISLTFHQKEQRVKCHYCDYSLPVPRVCPECQSEHIRFFGSGTQKVEEALTQLLPEARVIRMDVDTTRRKGSHEKLLGQFGSRQADILLGTQMIAKGLDFPYVTLVGVLAADTTLHIPDFRSAEKTFQLLTQVGGRAGRHELPGEVIIQSYDPEHYSIVRAQHHDYDQFYVQEMMFRKQHDYPPFFYLTLITVSHESYVKAQETTKKMAVYLKKHLTEEAVILGPVAPAVARIKDRYRSQCMIKYKREPGLMPALKGLLDHYQNAYLKDGLSITIDVNPYAIM
ncbi:primosomal protein N' [Pullulanibacillus sp. KACC 23026]|uniref:primosomal protein N' n=1 Tax=Pullulanibacillus sp. KACC 23026 TaxID=3028315 RepID=UPI0023B0B052|nr:primosomal protein N' [Pullulanibacillus sp. KACC 23026]WEG11630.1 primosomal protein N' [Pullulanibacillus sp. KACC 23026]